MAKISSGQQSVTKTPPWPLGGGFDRLALPPPTVYNGVRKCQKFTKRHNDSPRHGGGRKLNPVECCTGSVIRISS